jgi:hypothetical protein
MKKFLVVALVLAALCIGSAAYALDVTVNGEAAVRSRWFQNMATNASPAAGTSIQPNHTASDANTGITQSRFLLEINVKADNNIKGKLALWNDFDTWLGRGKVANDSNAGTNKGLSGNTSSVFIREAWIDFMVPGIPVGVKGGRMLGRLGEGWFLRSEYGGHEGWILYVPIGKSTIAFQEVLLNEGTTSNGDDSDLYSLVATIKPTDAVTIGFNASYMRDNRTAGNLLGVNATAQGRGELYNIGLNWNAKVGAATIKGEVDVQQGRVQTTAANEGVSLDGYQGILQASIPAGPVTINVGGAYGTGSDINNTGRKSQVITMLDSGQHYTLIYEYQLRTAAGAVNTGFANTTALNAGAMVAVAKSLDLGVDIWWFKANEWVALNGAGANAQSKDIGLETDLKVNWKISPNLTWGWQAAYFVTGNAYKNVRGVADNPYAIQGVLSLKF